MGFNNNKTSVAQLMSDLFGVFIGIGITASSDQMRGHHHRATVIFLGSGIMIVHVLGIIAVLKDWRLLNTGGKFLTFRCFNLLASLGLSIYFWVLDGWHWHSTSLRLPSYILSVLNQILYLVLFSILIGQFCIYKKRNSLNPTKNTKQAPKNSSTSSSSVTEEDIYENGDVFIKSDKACRKKRTLCEPRLLYQFAPIL